MENQTRIGIGASAMIALVLYFAVFGWVYAIPALLICASVAIWGLWPGIRALARAIANSGKHFKAAVVVCGLVLLGAGIGGLIASGDYAFWTLSPDTGQIVWNFGETASGHGYFLNLQKPGDGQEIKVSGFGAHGKNNSSEPITDFEGYVRSDLTNETAPIYLVAVEAASANFCSPPMPTLPKDTSGIPAFADFDVVTYSKPFYINLISDEAVPLSSFLSRFVPFTVVVKYNGKTYQRQFSRAEVDKQVAFLEKIAAPMTIPRVVRKGPAPLIPLSPPVTPRPSVNANPDITSKIPDK